ncbi:MAG: hypothetical protein JWO08_2590 [Verrucomicrobiaceae bacterium]|nr:hypothetical protein [Verrucomicrobiaceae bacterium]
MLGSVALAGPLPVTAIVRKTPVDFSGEVYPVLKANCIACHNKTTTKGGLNVETPELMKKGGESGTAIEPGKGADSLLLQSAAHQGDSDMPPKGNKVGAVNLTPEELGLIKLWIDQGANPGKKRVQQIAWQPLPPGLHPIYATAMSPGGEFATCSRANQVFVYDLASRQLAAQFVGHRDMTLALAFSPDGMRLASGSFGEVKIWRREPVAMPMSAAVKAIMDAVAKLQQASRSVGLTTLDVVFHTSAINLATTQMTAFKERVKKANDAIGDTQKKLEEKEKAMKAATDAKLAAQKALDEVKAVVEKAPKDKPDPVLAKKQTDAQTKLDAAIKAEGGAADMLRPAERAVADAKAEVPKVIQLQAKAEKTLTDAKAAQAVAQAAQKKANDEVAAATKLVAESVKAGGAVLLSPDQRWLAEAQPDGSSTIWAMGSGLPVANFVPKAGAKPALSWKPDNQLTWPADSGALVTQHMAPKWILERTMGTGDAASVITDRVNALGFSPDGKTVAVGSGAPSRGGDITIWDTVTGKLMQAIRDRHSDAVLSLEISPDGKLIASGGADKQLRISEMASGKLLKTFDGHTHHVMGVSWRADGRVVASSGADNAVKVWDWVTGERRKNLDGWDKEVTSVHYLGTSNRLLTTCGDKQVRLIGEDASAPAALAGTTDFMQSASASRSGQWVAAGGEDSVLRVWEAKGGAIMASFAAP